MDEKLHKEKGSSEKLIRFVRDRAGHDLRYAIDPSRLVSELNWKPSVKFEDGLAITVDWYLRNQAWLDHITSGVYQEYYRKHYNFQ
jgi:dTDP-glucose 4,6-dehydratase